LKIINLPFNDWSKQRIAEGVKTATSRNKRYGSIGDRFIIGDKIFEFDTVIMVPLWFVTKYLLATEGAFSKNEFIEIWNNIHPKKNYTDDHLVWYHHFREIDL